MAIAAALAMAVAACAEDTHPEARTASIGFAECATRPNDCNGGGKAKQGGTITYALGKDIKSWNTMSSSGNTTDTMQALFGVLPRAYVFYPDLTVQVNRDLLESVRITETNPMTVVYAIKGDAVWNDGTAVSADDFIYAWRVQNGRDCIECKSAATSGFRQVRSVSGADGGKTVTVEFSTPYPDWQGLFGPLYPAHIAAAHGTLAQSFTWFEQNVPNYSAGPYQVERFEPNVALTLVPNKRWWGAKVLPDRVVFRIITKDSELVNALRNREVQVISPAVPTADLVAQIKQVQGAHWHIGKALSWEHFDLNLKNPFLADRALRQAIFTAIDRKAIIAKTVGQYSPGTQPLNNHNFVPGMRAYRDVVSATGQGSGDVEGAKKILGEAGYRIENEKLVTPSGQAIPPLRIRYTTGNQIRKDSCELFAEMVKPLGLQVQVEQTDDLGTTVSTGDFDVVLFAWNLAPLRIGGAYQQWHSTSNSNYGKWVNPQSDQLLEEAVKTIGDENRAHELVNQSNELLAMDAYVLPLFQRDYLLAVSEQYTNIRPNPTNHGMAYNIGSWALLGEAG